MNIFNDEAHAFQGLFRKVSLSFQNKTFILDKYTWREGINNDNPKSIKTYLFISSVFSLANSGWIPISRDSSLELVRTKIWKNQVPSKNSDKISQILRFDQSLFVLVMTTARLEKGMPVLNNVWDWSLLLVFRRSYQNLKQKNYRSSSVLISWSIRAAKFSLRKSTSSCCTVCWNF